jgi:hypothetical protein
VFGKLEAYPTTFPALSNGFASFRGHDMARSNTVNQPKLADI